MENNKICPNCKTSNTNDSNFCSNCGNILDQKDTNIDKVEDNNGTKLGIIALVLYFGASMISYAIAFILPSDYEAPFSALFGLCPLAGIVVMIVGRVKYPTNTLLKTAMWLIIVFTIMGIIYFVLIMIMCYVACSNFDTRGCY